MFHFLCFEIRGSNKLMRQPIELSGQRAAIEAVTAERFNRLSLPKEMIILFPGPGGGVGGISAFQAWLQWGVVSLPGVLSKPYH